LKLFARVEGDERDFASPGLPAGRGLKPFVSPADTHAALGFARPPGRARIETATRWIQNGASLASPGLPAGRGLKLCRRAGDEYDHQASPGLPAGRGLKQNLERSHTMTTTASPGLPAGRGLKHLRQCQPGRHDQGASPGLPAGRGLKRADPRAAARRDGCFARPPGRARIETLKAGTNSSNSMASPGLPAGRGLKHRCCQTIPARCALRPASRPGAD